MSVSMVSGFYDIFKRNEQGVPVWVDAVKHEENAKARIMELSKVAPGQYLVVHSRTGRMITAGTVVSSDQREKKPPDNDSGETLIG